MKKGIILTAVILLITVSTGLSVSQSNERETRDLRAFTKISFGVAGNLYINIGPEFSVVLEGDRSYLEHIDTEVSGGRLVIKKDSWRNFMNEKVTVYITMPAIEGLGVSGSGKAEIKDAVKTDDLNLSVSGSGKLYTTDITAGRMKCSISGSGDIILVGNGNVGMADISISGSGNYFGEPAKTESLSVSISGSGNCSCNVTGSLRASVSGSGNVSYLGSPKIDARVSGSGKVRSK